jgi:hypothetical protein
MRPVTLRLLAITSLVLAASCDSAVTAPAPKSTTTANRLLLPSATTVNVVTRNTPLASPVSVSKTIGALGGTISIPGAGLKVIVPPLSLISPKTITVTAIAGNQVAYEFEPHGTQFLVPLLVSQNLTGTSAYNGGLLQLGLRGAYFANTSDLNPGAGTALVSELLGVALNLSAKTATFPVFHFSGYLVATGMNGSDDQ